MSELLLLICLYFILLSFCTDADQSQVVPHSPKEPITRSVKGQEVKEITGPEETDFKWFDFFPEENNELTQPEE